MSVSVNYWEWPDAKTCLEWLFKNHPDMKCYDGLHIWQEYFATLDGGHLAGGYRHVRPEMLEGRNYTVHWHNDSVGICYHDRVYADVVENRRYPEQTRCVVLKLPTNG